MMRTAPAARAIVAAFALVLLLPALGPLVQDAVPLQAFHHRTLRAWPESGDLVRDPAAWFAAARAWYADRVWGLAGAAVLLKSIEYYVLHDPPQRRISLAADGYIFLNGESDDAVNGLLEKSCVAAHVPAVVPALQDALRRYARYGRARGVHVDVVVVPTLATIYGDRLPASIPERLRDACRARTQGDSPLARVAVPDGVHYVYPLAAMLAARDDPRFYPHANYHPSGLSLVTVRDAYRATLGAVAPIAKTLTPTLTTSDVMRPYGIDVSEPVYAVHNAAVVPDAAQAQAWNAAIADLFAGGQVESQAYVDAAAPSPDAVLMLTDSFGRAAAEVFAGAYRSLYQVNTNAVEPAKIDALVTRLLRLHRFDRVIVLVQEGNVPRLVVTAAALDAVN